MIRRCASLILIVLVWAMAGSQPMAAAPVDAARVVGEVDRVEQAASAQAVPKPAAGFSLFLPLVGKSYEWQVDCVSCPKSFWAMTDRSLRLDNQGHPHIVSGGYDLYHTWFDGTLWHDETVISSPNRTEYPALALDSQGRPHISYVDWTNYPDTALKYARWTGQQWIVQTVDIADYAYTSIALDTANRPYISYNNGAALKCAHWTGQQWVTEVVEQGGWIVGHYNSIALDAANRPHISYDGGNGLAYAHWTGSLWATQAVDDGGLTGQVNSLALDDNGNPHISYISGDNLNYAYWASNSWHIETIDTNVYGYPGMSTSIDLDSQGRPHISYVDHPQRILKYAYWTGDAWNIQTTIGQFCGPSSLALDSNDLAHIACHDYTNEGLRYAHKLSFP